MNFVSRIPRPLLIAVLATIGFMLTSYAIDGLLYHRAVPMSWFEFIFFLFVKNFSGIVATIAVWLGVRRIYKNAWAVAIITGFAMLGLCEFIGALIGPLVGPLSYTVLLLVTWGLLVANIRLFASVRSNRAIVMFCGLLIFCSVLWVAGRIFSAWMYDMRVEEYFRTHPA
jgi:hypothetical protein